MPQVISNYKHTKLTSMSPTTDVPTDKVTHVIVSDDNINCLFGWSLWKTKRNYKKMVDNGSVNSTYELMWKVLDDMTVNILDVADNLQYIRIYYPADGVMRNRGNLTLISPICIKSLSLLLSLTHKTLQDFVEENYNLMPSKKYILKTMKRVLELQANNHVDDICHATVTRLPNIKIDMDDCHHLV